MSDYETILFQVGADGVARITLNRPEERNVMTPKMIREVQDALRRVHRHTCARVLVLSANGKAFCPGIGRDKGASPIPKRVSAIPIEASIPRLLYTAPIPTIAAVNGACAGVGLGLACACDLRVSMRGAVFRSAFLSVGLAGDMGLPWLLTRIVGAARAREISFLDQKITADQALAMGLVSQLFEAADFAAEVDKLATRLANGPQLATRALKSHYLAAERMGFEDFIDLEFQRHFHLAATEDFEEGWKAQVERRPPVFSGRQASGSRSASTPSSPLSEVAMHHDLPSADTPMAGSIRRLTQAPHPLASAAIIDRGSGVTWSRHDLSKATQSLATTLRGLGLGEGDSVAICLPNGPEFVAAYHGTLLADGVALMVDFLAPLPHIQRVLKLAKAKALVATTDMIAQLAPHLEPGMTVICVGKTIPATSALQTVQWQAMLNADASQEGPWSQAIPTPAADATAVLTETSGTAGDSKLVRLTDRNLLANLNQIHMVHCLKSGDVVIATTPLRHIFAMQMAMNHALYAGVPLVLLGPRFDLSAFLAAIEAQRVTHAYVVPTIVEQLLHAPTQRYDLSSLRVIFSGGAPLSRETARICAERLNVQVIQGFGMTESGCTHLVPDALASEQPEGIGRPLPSTDVMLIDPETGAEVAQGASGELWVRGPQISPGYLGSSEPLTDPAGWLHTGEIAEVDGAGLYRIVGRIKEMIKYKGYRIAPAELEALLLQHPDVADAAVVGVPDPLAGEIPKAFVVLHRATSLNEIVDTVATRTAPYKRIRLIEAIAEIPRSAAGKIQRALLAARASPTEASLSAAPHIAVTEKDNI